MDTFLERHKLSKLTQKELKTLNRFLTNRDIYLDIKPLLYTESLGSMDSVNSTKCNEHNCYQSSDVLKITTVDIQDEEMQDGRRMGGSYTYPPRSKWNSTKLQNN